MSAIGVGPGRNETITGTSEGHSAQGPVETARRATGRGLGGVRDLVDGQHEAGLGVVQRRAEHHPVTWPVRVDHRTAGVARAHGGPHGVDVARDLAAVVDVRALQVDLLADPARRDGERAVHRVAQHDRVVAGLRRGGRERQRLGREPGHAQHRDVDLRVVVDDARVQLRRCARAR